MGGGESSPGSPAPPYIERTGTLSIAIMSRYWRDAPYDGTQLLLLLALADYADDRGYCFPTQKQLAQKCRCSERHVRNLMKDLIADGVVRVIDNKGNNRYQLMPVGYLSTGTTVPPEKISAGTPDPIDRNPSSYTTGNPLPNNHQEPSITTNKEATYKCSWCGREDIPKTKRCYCSHARMNGGY